MVCFRSFIPWAVMFPLEKVPENFNDGSDACHKNFLFSSKEFPQSTLSETNISGMLRTTHTYRFSASGLSGATNLEITHA